MTDKYELPIKRSDALEQGVSHYFTQRQCRNGHSSKRRASDGKCLACDWNNQKRKRANNPDYHRSVMRRYYSRNVDALRERNRKWREDNPEKARYFNNLYGKTHPEEARASERRWRLKNKEHRNGVMRRYLYKRRHEDIHFRLVCNLRSRLHSAIKGKYKTGSAISELGCSIDELKQHIESLFSNGMTWENWGEWHIDHIEPLSSFDLSYKEQVSRASHYSNLQPLWASENLKKGGA